MASSKEYTEQDDWSEFCFSRDSIAHVLFFKSAPSSLVEQIPNGGNLYEIYSAEINCPDYLRPRMWKIAALLSVAQQHGFTEIVKQIDDFLFSTKEINLINIDSLVRNLTINIADLRSSQRESDMFYEI